MNRREFPKELQEYYRDFEGSYRLPATPSKETDHVDIRTVTLTRQETQRLKTKCEQKGISLPGYVEYCFGRGLLIALSKETAWFSHTYSGRDENCVKMAEYIRPWKNLNIHGEAVWHGILELTASFAFGNTTIWFPDENVSGN